MWVSHIMGTVRVNKRPLPMYIYLSARSAPKVTPEHFRAAELVLIYPSNSADLKVSPACWVWTNRPTLANIY